MGERERELDVDDAGDPAGHFLAAPNVRAALEQMLDQFALETDRGAVLIAAEIASNHLEHVLRELAPSAMNPKRMKALLGYPGLLSSFSGRIDVCFLAGFIAETEYQSLNVLRRLRNQAAHSENAFRLAEHQVELRQMCELGPGTAPAVRAFAVETIMKTFVARAMQAGARLESDIGHNPFSSPEKVIDYLDGKLELLSPLEERVPRMELAIGMWILLGLVNLNSGVTARRPRSRRARAVDAAKS